MSKMRIAEDSSIKIVLEKSLKAKDIWRGWSRPLFMPLLFLIGSSSALFTGFIREWLLWVFFVIALLVVISILSDIIYHTRKITVTIDLHSNVATRFEKFITGKKSRNELALDQVSRVLIQSKEHSHAPNTTIWLDAPNDQRLEILNKYDLLSLVQGSYMPTSSEDVSEIKSLDILAKKIGEFLGKPIVRMKTDYQGNIISEETKSSFESEYSANKDSLQAAQKEYQELLSSKEEISTKETEIRPILYYPLKGIVMLLLLGGLTTLYAVLLDRLSSAFSLDLGSYGVFMLAVSLILAIGTMLYIRKKMG